MKAPNPSRRRNIEGLFMKITIDLNSVRGGEGFSLGIDHGLVYQEQVIVEIVSWLPIESVIQCRCVCKTWNSLLHEPYFTQLHTNRRSNSSSPLNLFRLLSIFGGGGGRSFGGRSIVRLEDYYDDEQQQQLKVIIISKPLNNNHVVILSRDPIGNRLVMSSCNGLICLFDYDGYYIVPAFIYNPITREYVILPHVGGDESKRVTIMNNRGVSASGFGYHSSKNEYKVVRIIHVSCSNTNTSYIRYVRIYTLGRSGGKWRIKEGEQVENKFKFKGVFVNGALHWLTVNGAKIVSFDLEHEKFRIISPSPPPLSLLPLEELTEKAGFDVGVLGQSLCITVQKGYVTDIWVMNNSNKQWSKEFTISTSIPPDAYRRNYCELVGITKRGRILCVYNRRHLICYDPITNSYDHHDYNVGSESSDIPRIVTNYFPLVPYRKSFVSLKALGEDAKLVEPGEEDAEVDEPVDEQQRLEQKYGLHMAIKRNWFGIHNHREVFGGRRVPSRIYSCSFTNNSGNGSNSSTGNLHSGDMKTKIVKLCISFVLSLFSFDI